MNHCQPYLIELSLRLREAAQPWPQRVKTAFAKFILSRHCPDGGFRGRLGGSDLYYTAFAVRGLHMLDSLDGAIAESVTGFAAAAQATNAIDLLSILYCLKLCSTRDYTKSADAIFREANVLLDKLMRDNGGYAKSPTSEAVSTYHTFLGLLCRDMLGETVENFDATLKMIKSRQQADGGFTESATGDTGSVNPTAAAVAVLVSGGEIDGAVIEAAVKFLLDSKSRDGGWRSSKSAPIADLLSSFTAALTLSDLGRLDECETEEKAHQASATCGLGKFLSSCKIDAGAGMTGFGGWRDDIDADVEYTFYGLGLAAILALVP